MNTLRTDNKLRDLIVLFLVALVFLGPPLAAQNSDPRVRPLLEEGLRLYSERQYVRALDLFKQVERIDPENQTARDYISSSEQRISEWEGDGAAPKGSGAANWDTLLKNPKKRVAGEPAVNASDIAAARKSLVERMRNRSTNTDNIVRMVETRAGLEVTLYHDQLFVPGLSTLRDEALPILENVALTIRDKGDRDVRVVSQAHVDSADPYLLIPDAGATLEDPSLPQTKGSSARLFDDVESTRALILFTHLAQRSMGRSVGTAD